MLNVNKGNPNHEEHFVLQIIGYKTYSKSQVMGYELTGYQTQ